MTVFWILATGLIALAGWLVLPPLLRRAPADDIDRGDLNLALQRKELDELIQAHAAGELDDASYRQACDELQRHALESASAVRPRAPQRTLGPATAALLILAVPGLAILGYEALGGGAVAIAQEQSGAAAPHTDRTATPAELPPIDQLTERLARRLQNEPDDVKGWLLLARSYHHLGRMEAAHAAYAQAQARGGEDAGFAALLGASVHEASDMPPAAAAATPDAVIRGQVDITPEMRARVSDDDTVFIFARALNGPRMPLAVLRRQVRDLPFEFTLDDSLAMQPQVTLSAFEQVMLGARVSRDGSVTQQPGEPRGDLGPVPTRGGGELRLLIDSNGS